MNKQPSINYEKCESCGTCCIVAPKLFGFKKDVTVVKKYNDSLKKDYLKAKKACPMGAII